MHAVVDPNAAGRSGMNQADSRKADPIFLNLLQSIGRAPPHLAQAAQPQGADGVDQQARPPAAAAGGVGMA